MSYTPKRLLPDYDPNGCSHSQDIHLAKRSRQDHHIPHAAHLFSQLQQLTPYERENSVLSLGEKTPPSDGQLPSQIDHSGESEKSSTSISSLQETLDSNDGAPEKDAVCFGMLCDIQIQLSLGQKGFRHDLKSYQTGSEKFNVVNVFLDDTKCVIRSEDNTPIALLNLKTYRALTLEIDPTSLSCIGLVRQKDLEQTLLDSTTHRSSRSQKMTCPMDLIICGPHHLHDRLSRNLSKSRLFLQHPTFLPDHRKYDNPHYLCLPGLEMTDGTVLPSTMMKTTIQEVEEGNTAFSESLQTINALDILDHIAVQSDLREVEMDEGLIRTTLKLYECHKSYVDKTKQETRHQKEGIDFILRREKPLPDDTNSLWMRPCSLESEPLYHHRICDTQSLKPRDPPGGILADDMGHGKTLTMICAIVQSLQQDARSDEQFYSPELKSRRIPTMSTLVVLPSVVLMDTWIFEIRRHVVDGKISYYKYHGRMRCLNGSASLPYHVVLTTYATVAKEYSRGGGMLNHFHWHRLVLDEAHTIRTPSSGQFQATMNLSANIRWCMTGTPIQNSIDDLASLFKFLRIPYLEDDRTFRKYIVGKASVSGAISRYGLENLKLALRAVCIRRSLLLVADSDVIYKEIKVDLTSVERAGYASIGKSIKEALDAAVSSHKSRGASQSVLRGILELRRFCNNGGRQNSSSSSHRRSKHTLDDKLSLLEQSSDTNCELCHTPVLINGQFDPIRLPHLTGCDSLVCGNCAHKIGPQTSPDGILAATTCVVCGNDHDSEDNVAEDSPDLSSKPSVEPPIAPTSKMHALITDIVAHHKEEKSIVFTFWISTLTIIENIFLQKGIPYRRVDGTLGNLQRAENLLQFRHDPTIRVLIMTLSTGAAGLNGLSVASRLHLVEPQWNPSVEDQAIGRVNRMGQDRQVTVLRYITNDSIETSIKNRQIQKKKLADASGLRAADNRNDPEDRATHRKEVESLLYI